MKFICSLLLILPLSTLGSLQNNPWGFPTTMTLEKNKLVLNGIGMRLATFFNIKVYAAALYLPQRAQDPSAIMSMKGPKVIDLYFLRNVSQSDIRKAWRKAHGMDEFPKEVSLLNSYMDQMKKNTHGLQFRIYDDGTVVKVGEKMHPKITNKAFARAILNIYLGPRPPNRELKTGMLGEQAP